MADLVVYIPFHGYANNTSVYVSWLNDIYYVADENDYEFKLTTAPNGSEYVEFTEDVLSGYIREIDSTSGVIAITGLEYLEGETVKVVSNGMVIATKTVVDGSVSVTGLLFSYSVGKSYTSTLIPMDLDIEGTGLSTTKRINRVMVNLYRTVGGQVGPDLANMEEISTGASEFTGFKEITIPGGYTRDTDITVRQLEPLPMTVLSLTYDLGASND